MSDLFNIYEDNLNSTIDRLKKIIETFINLSKEKAEYAIQDANNCFKEAEKMLKQMDIECSANSNKTGSKLTMKLRNHNNEFESVKKQFLKLQENYISQKSREALILGSEDNREGDTGGFQKNKLIENEEVSWNQSNKLEHAKIVALEAEKVSVEVMRNLDGHTNQMKSVKLKVDHMNGNLEESNSLLDNMKKIQFRNKKIILISALVLVIILVFILIVKLS